MKTGRFGVGFKSVFAFTATPIIISGEEHFRIHGLYRISEHPYPEGFSPHRTRIILPFNHGTEKPDYVEDLMAPEDAYSKIAARLSGLNMNTLLFTRTVREIRWQIEGSSGHYLRKDKPRDDARHTTITDGRKLNRYLVFARIPAWHGQQFKPVEIAFGLDEKEDQITAIQDFLYVLFATTQETHLQFVINGPYRTNPSRETIAEDDPFNCHLIKETCNLLREILPQLRDGSLLTTQCLGVLPNPTDNLRDFYAPSLKMVLDTFRSQELVPTDDNTYATAASILQGPAALREIVTTKELPFLTGLKTPRWAKGVVQNTRPDHFLKGLKITQWGWDELQKTLEKKFGGYSFTEISHGDAKWLAELSDDWLQRLYVLLGEAIKKNDCTEWMLQRCRIIRVTENGTETHVTGTKAYFPKGRRYGDLPQIKREILRGKSDQQTKRIEAALIALGVKQIGDEERIDLILDTYYSEGSPHVGKKPHIAHMQTFVRWWRKEKSAVKFSGQAIFRTAGAEKLSLGKDCYIDTPIQSTGLSQLYGSPRPGIEPKSRLWSRYKDISKDGFCDFAVACGVLSTIPIKWQDCYDHPNEQVLRQDYNKYGVRFRGGKNNDYDIPNLDALLKVKDIQINAQLWRTMCRADPEVLEAVFQPNQRYKERRDKSSLILKLSKSIWIPDKKGVLHQPAQISKNDLHPDFKYDNQNGWLNEIGFGEGQKLADQEYQKRKEMARTLGVRSGIVELLKDLPADAQAEIQEQFEDMLKKRAAAHRRAQRLQQTALPFHEALATSFQVSGVRRGQTEAATAGTSRNPVRRQEKLTDEIAAAIQNESSLGTRFTFGICKKWKSKDDVVRVKLLQWYDGRCQICKRTFTQQNGQPYFEGLYLVPHSRADWIDRPGNVICLCPWHSAMFQFGTKEVDDDIVERILSFVPKGMGGRTEPTLKIALCGENVVLTFVEDHFLELQVMARESKTASAAK
ncbi:MAG: hypothetical protein HY360_21185 [Verrucomicrobia bacterium]|nr:hypothetical protein [Verrucomicrobiota bacterium]